MNQITRLLKRIECGFTFLTDLSETLLEMVFEFAERFPRVFLLMAGTLVALVGIVLSTAIELVLGPEIAFAFLLVWIARFHWSDR